MNSLALYRGMLLISLALLGYVILELTYLGALRFELARGSESRAQLIDLGARLIDARAELASLPPLIDRPDDDSTFSGATPEQSLISLQEIVQGIVVSSGAMPMALQGSQEPGGPGLARLTVLVRASFSEQALLAFLRQIESSPNHISVHKLDVQPPAATQAGTPGLDVTVVVGAIHKNAV